MQFSSGKERGQGIFAPGLSAMLSSKEMLDRMISHLHPAGHERVLDLGVGIGNTLFALAPLVSSIVGIDADQKAIEECKSQIAERGLGQKACVRLIERDQIAELPKLFASASFEIITCRAAFHHFPNPRKVMDGVQDLLKPGGLFDLMDPVFSEQSRAIWTPIARIRETDLESFYTLQEYIDYILESGLQIECMVPFRARRKLGEWIRDAPSHIQCRLRETILKLNEGVRRELNFREDEGDWEYFYNAFEIICRRI